MSDYKRYINNQLPRPTFGIPPIAANASQAPNYPDVRSEALYVALVAKTGFPIQHDDHANAFRAPQGLVAVVGATGTQGGSVIRALEESDTAYRVRGFTRDAIKPAAQELVEKGVDVVTVSLVVENAEKVYEAFAGADFAFLVTNFWEHLSVEKEVAEGKLLIDAAKAAGVTRTVWSGLTSVSKTSGGKYVHVVHYDGKAAVAEYGRQSGVPFVDVQAGFYASNFRDSARAMPMELTAVIPVLDVAHDYGLYVRRVLELSVFPDGSEVLTSGDNIAAKDIAQQLAEGELLIAVPPVTGKKVVFKQISAEQFGAKIAAMGLPPHIVQDMSEAFPAIGEFGYYGSKATASLEGLARKPRTWKEFVQVTDWSKVLA
ncbi:NAD(P)-binding protein [Mycena galericulata]|nr:NAD(P)-binding protein [Mycena galericulata]